MIFFAKISEPRRSEIIAELLERTVPTFIAEPIAEALLAGIMSATESFQKKNTTPKSLKAAAELPPDRPSQGTTP